LARSLFIPWDGVDFREGRGFVCALMDGGEKGAWLLGNADEVCTDRLGYGTLNAGITCNRVIPYAQTMR
jgi:hypothetical protein